MRIDGDSTDALTGENTQHSSDGTRITSGCTIPSRVQRRQASRHFDALRPPRVGESATTRPTRSSLCEQARRQVIRIAPFETTVAEQLERIQVNIQQHNPSPPNLHSETTQHVVIGADVASFEESYDPHLREKMVMMERQVRIAEREGAFDDAKRKKKFAKTYFHRSTQRQRLQASAKLKAKVAREQKKIDRKFRQSQEETSTSPKDAWDRIRRWSRGDVGIVGEGGERSAVEVGAGESGYASDDEFSTTSSERRVARRREEAAAAARYAGIALRSAPFIF